MKEISRILAVYQGIDFSQRMAALATVVRVEGSSYRRPGARMLITDDGRWEGAISGGCLEGDALRKARQVMRSGKPLLVTYDTMDDAANSFGIGLGCNGIIEVLIEALDPADAGNPVLMLAGFVGQRDAWVLSTVVSGSHPDFPIGRRFLTAGPHAEPYPDWLQADMARVLAGGKPLTKLYQVANHPVRVYTERLNPGIELRIFGAGYDTLPLITLAQQLGWQVTVSDDCVAHLVPKRFPAATCLLYADRHAVLDQLSLTDRTATVLMSHNYGYDLAVLKALLSTSVPYIGVLGPRKRFEKMQLALEKEGHGFDPDTYARVHAPIGLDIGAETPEEIALAIVGEIQSYFAGRRGGSLKEKPGRIHQDEDSVWFAL